MRQLFGRKTPSIFIALGLGCLLVAAVSTPASAAPDVTPQTIPNNPSDNVPCDELDDTFGGGQTWLELKTANGTTDTVLGGVVDVDFIGNTVTWTSTIGIDAVYVKSSGPGTQIYVYAPTPDSPEAFGDDGLTTANGQGISHVAFCFDLNNPTTTSSTTSSSTTSSSTTSTTAPTTTSSSSTTSSSTTSTTVLGTTTSTSTTIVLQTTLPPTTVGGRIVLPGPTAPPTTPPPTVLGTVIAQELPRTGSSNGPLAVAGVLLVLIGIVLQGQQRRLATASQPQLAPWCPPDFPG